VSWRRERRRETASIGTSARAAVLPYVAARVIVLGALGLCHLLVGPLNAVTSAKAKGTVHSGLLSWDAAIYLRIAETGYAGAGRSAVRFFPLFPLLGRWLGALPGISDGAALIIIANVAAFGALVALHMLVTTEELGRKVPSTSVWLLALFPAAFVLVMGYAEALFLLLSIVAFLCWRTGRFAASIVPAYLAGLCRPIGVLLAIPAAVEVFLLWRSAHNRPRSGKLGIGRRVGQVLAVLAAPGGFMTYLSWVHYDYDNWTLPISEQLNRHHRGGVADPVATLLHDASDLLHGHHLGSAMHAPFAIVFVLVTIYICVRLPASYAWYTLATMAVALTAPNLDSFERYGLACFPIVIGLATMVNRRIWRVTLIGVSAVMLATLSVLAFLGMYVP
jgi:hypothetical protein